MIYNASVSSTYPPIPKVMWLLIFHLHILNCNHHLSIYICIQFSSTSHLFSDGCICPHSAIIQHPGSLGDYYIICLAKSLTNYVTFVPLGYFALLSTWNTKSDLPKILYRTLILTQQYYYSVLALAMHYFSETAPSTFTSLQTTQIRSLQNIDWQNLPASPFIQYRYLIVIECTRIGSLLIILHIVLGVNILRAYLKK